MIPPMARVLSLFPVAGAVLLLTGATLPAPLGAQAGGSSSLGGVTVDPSGTPLSGVEIRIRHVPTGTLAVAVSDSEGRFRLANLRPGGPYTVEARRLGLQEWRMEEVRLLAGEHRRLEIQLIVAPIALEGVTVEARTLLPLSPSRMGVAHVTDEAAVRAFPSLNRDPLELAELSPMVHREGGRVSVAGQNDRFNVFQVDGLLLQDASGFPRGDLPDVRRKPLPMEAIQQYRVAASPFDVRESGFQGGLLQATTRTGSNRWDASAFGLFRHEFLLGDLDYDGFPVSSGDFRKALAGFSVGGPLRVDRTHLFAAGEFEYERRAPQGLHVGEVGAMRVGLVADSVRRTVEILRQVYGGEAGETGSYPLENPMANLFLRLDHQWADNRTVTFRHMLAWSREDLSPNRTPVGTYGLSGSGVRWDHLNVLGGVELSTRSRGGWGNLFMIQYQRSSDRARPNSTFPQVDVRLLATTGGNLFTSRAVGVGAPAAAHGLELDQELLEIRNEVSRTFRRHHVAAGGSFRFTGVRHLYHPGSRGVYYFDDLLGLQFNLPDRYEITLLPDGVADAREYFDLREPSFFVEDEWSPVGGLTLRGGIRADATWLPRRPEANPALGSIFGEDNSRWPVGWSVSPRVGVNWQGVLLGGLTQLSGGAGVFQGRIPLEWIASGYAWTGTRRVEIVCLQDPLNTTRVAPPLVPGAPPPDRCVTESYGRTDVPPAVQFFAEDLSPPRDLKVALSVDRELPGRLALTLEGLYSRSLSALHLEDINLPLPLESEESTAPDGLGPRVRYSRPYTRLRRRHDAFGPVIRVGNRSLDRALSFLGELRGELPGVGAFRAGYAFTQALTLQTLTSADAISSFGRNPVAVDPNGALRRPSPFLRPHTVTLSLFRTIPDRWGGTEVGLRYRGMSGRPFSYVYYGDANGDGFDGYGLARETFNDLLYIPHGVSGREMPRATPVTRAVLHRLIEAEPCLRNSRGTILERAECTGPWTNRLDLKAVRRVSSWRGGIEVAADLVNVLNLVNGRWGRVEDVEPVVPILRFIELPAIVEGGPSEVGFTYIGPVTRDADGEVWPLLPYSPDPVASRWQAQLGVRVRF